ncbi:MAG: glycosyltransferase [Anaerolineales bacterium]|nr:glycosyltransferase [Anaerolineales bacterium]
MVPKILIAGHYGFGNIGDEAILAGMLADLRARSPGSEITVLTGDDSHPSIKPYREISWTNLPAILDAVRASDLIILGGGGLFHDYWGCDPSTILSSEHVGLSYFSGIPLAAYLFEKPLMLYSVGIGPLQSDEAVRLTEMCVGLADMVAVRDECSLNYIKAKLNPACWQLRDIFQTADPAAGLTRSYIEATSDIGKTFTPADREPIVGVALRDWPWQDDASNWPERAARAIDNIVETINCQIHLLRFQFSPDAAFDDLDFAYKIIAASQNPRAIHAPVDIFDPFEMMDHIASCDAILAMRLHALHFGFSHGIPSVALAYDPKISDLMKAAGLEAYCIPMDQVHDVDVGMLVAKAIENQDRVALREFSLQSRELAVGASRSALSLIGKKPSRSDYSAGIAQEMLATRLAKSGSSKTLDSLLNAEIEVLLGQIRRLHDQLDRQEGEILQVKMQKLRSEEQLRLTGRELQERDEKIVALDEQLSEVTHTGMALQSSLWRVEQELEEIHSARFWKAMGVYWSARGLVEKGILKLYRTLRGQVPGKLRADFRKLRLKAPHRLIINPMKYRIDPPWHSDPIMPANVDFLILPIIDWDFRIQRPQQLARRLANAGHRIFYLSPNFIQGDTVEWRSIEENLFEVRIPGPSGVSIYTDILTAGEVEEILAALDNFRFHAGLADAITVVQLPFWLPVAQGLRNRNGWRMIYDCMDEHSGFSTNSKSMLDLENTLIKESDLIWASSRALVAKCEQAGGEVLHVPNGVDEHLLNIKGGQEVPAEIAGLTGPIIGYIGAISSWFDFDLIRSAADRHPEWLFILVGSAWGADPHQDLARYENVHFLGERSYERIPGFLNSFDVCLIPFKLNNLTNATDPVKFYEYLAFGKPIVATALPELPSDHILVRKTEDPDSFVTEIEVALSEDNDELKIARRDFASRNTWRARGELILERLPGLFPNVSMIIPTWNNWKHTEMFLDSLDRSTSYPAVEYIFVDNGSSDRSVDFLLERAQQDPRVCVMTNPENRGFAAAVNQGLRAANGEYIFILNNDIVPTRGWLSKLVNILEQDETIGLVGPVTNSVGNEAIVHLDYKDFEEMELAAYAYSRERIGEVVPIPMLAMYCAGGRKKVFEEVGMLDERFRVGMFEDDDYSLRIRKAGYKVVCARDVFVHHSGSASFNLRGRREYREIFKINRKLFEEKWGRSWVHPVHEGLDEIMTGARQLAEILDIEGNPENILIIPSQGDYQRLSADHVSAALVEDSESDPLTFHIEMASEKSGFRRLRSKHYLASVHPVVFDHVSSPLVLASGDWVELMAYLRAPILVEARKTRHSSTLDIRTLQSPTGTKHPVRPAGGGGKMMSMREQAG